MKKFQVLVLASLALLLGWSSACGTRKPKTHQATAQNPSAAKPATQTAAQAQDRPNLPETTSPNDLPADNPPPGYIRPTAPKPLENVPKDCQDKSKASRETCHRLYDPVCGCNNVTYTNDCLARPFHRTLRPSH